MSPEKRAIYDDPSSVAAVDGAVEQVDVAMTPEAAEETSERLAEQQERWYFEAVRSLPATLARAETMSPEKRAIYDDPSSVAAVDGAVELDGPDAVDVAMTPEAAEETSERLAEQAIKARGQRRLRNYPHREQDG